MQYEVYPENTEQASRQIFIVNEVEVRDRLSLSKINKFLYQYTSESLPRQTHANMVCLFRKENTFFISFHFDTSIIWITVI